MVTVACKSKAAARAVRFPRATIPMWSVHYELSSLSSFGDAKPKHHIKRS